MGLCSLVAHYKSHGGAVFLMTKRKPVPIHPLAGSTEDDPTKEADDDELIIEDTTTVPPPTLQEP
jgi:hypothetical protein